MQRVEYEEEGEVRNMSLIIRNAMVQIESSKNMPIAKTLRRISVLVQWYVH